MNTASTATQTADSARRVLSQGSWNDCCKASTRPARSKNIDDIGFVRRLIALFHADYGIDTSRVFAFGLSLGGFFVYRLALELPSEVPAVAVGAANLPVDDNLDCRSSGKPIPVLITGATADDVCPYQGGPLGSDGAFRSIPETAGYFARLNGHSAPPRTTRLPHQVAGDPTSVDRTVWAEAGKAEVVLITVNGGGHVVPLRADVAAPRGIQRGAWGGMTNDIDLAPAVWDFFSRQHPLR